MDRQSLLRQNVQRVRERIAAVAEVAMRSPADIALIAVTKYVDDQAARDLAMAGCLDLAESRPQSLWSKAEALSDLPIHWHQVGHLQRNKLRRTLPLASLIHSVDSLRLLEAIDHLQAELSDDSQQPILLEVNISGDQAKDGFHPDHVAGAVETALAKPHVQLRGLMCMAGLATDEDGARRDFAKLRTLRDQLQNQYPDAKLEELSMGMSGDFEQAILEGATMVRVGSVLFEGVL